MNEDNETPDAIALLVDDHEGVLRSVSRALEGHFHLVLTATNQEEAEKHLESNRVTHVVCDYDLGEGQPRGTTLLSNWRGQYPGIQRALILTGTQPSTLPPAPIGVDEVLDKMCSREVLLSKLGV
jgi:DNA-binding NtrC family response regulator